MEKHNLLEKLLNEIRQNGIGESLNKSWRKVKSFLFFTTISLWYERDLSMPVKVISSGSDIEREFLEEDKTPLVDFLLENQYQFPWIYFEKEIESATKNKHIFYIIKKKERIIGYVKIGIGSNYIHDFDKNFNFPFGIAFIYDTFIFPEYRGKSIAFFALNEIAQYFKEKKFKKIICHIEEWNKPSVKVFQKAGFRAVDTIRFIKIAWFSFFLRNDYFPFLNFENYLRKYGLR